MKKVNRHHLGALAIAMLCITIPALAQKKSKAPLEKWYPVFRQTGCNMPAYINKAGEIKLAFDSTISLAVDAVIYSNIFNGEYVGVVKTEGNKKTYCLADRKGNLRPLPDGWSIARLNPNSVTVKQGYKKWGLVSYDLTPITPLKYAYIKEFNEGLACAELEDGGRFTLLDENGKETIPPTHYVETKSWDGKRSHAYQNTVSEGMSNYSENGRLGVMDKNGNNITPAKFDYLYEFNSGLAYASVDQQSGYINKKGEWVIGPAPDNKYYGNFSDGLLKVEDKTNKMTTYYYIDSTGRTILDGKYRVASEFSYGHATVTLPDAKPGERAIINKAGKVLYKGFFVDAWFFKDLIVITTEGRFASYDLKSNNYYYMSYDFKPVWEPPCSERRVTSLTSIRNCDPKEFTNIYLGSMDNTYTLEEVQDFLNKVNPKYLAVRFKSSVNKAPAAISNMTNLEELKLSFNEINELPDMSKLTNLKILDLEYTNITAFPKSLHQLKQLRKVNVKNSKITLKEVIALKESLPDTKIVFKD